MSVIHGVRVRGHGTRNLTWTVGRALVGKELDRAAKAAAVTALKAYFDAEYAVARALEPLEDEIDDLEDDEAELEYVEDLDGTRSNAGRAARHLESRGELSNEDLEELGYREEGTKQ